MLANPRHINIYRGRPTKWKWRAGHIRSVRRLRCRGTGRLVEFGLESGSVVEEGKDLELRCISDIPWDSCKITHDPSERSCKHHQIKKNTLYEAQVDDCKDFKGRFEYTGNTRGRGRKCGIRILNSRLEDDDEWTCRLDFVDNYAARTLRVGMLAGKQHIL